MNLTPKQQSLVRIATFEAKGDLARLSQALDEGLDNGLTVAESKEALSQLYAYTGFPRAINATGCLQQVLATRAEAGKKTEEGEEPTALPDGFDALKIGTEVQTRLCGGKPFVYAFSPRMDYYLKAHLFGDIFAGEALGESDREIVTVSAIAVLEGCDPQLSAHIAGALAMGVTPAQLDEIAATLDQATCSIEAYRVRKAIAKHRQEPFTEGAPVDFSRWPKGEPNTAYARYFTGNSYLASMDSEHGGPVNVTFEPRCRNHWHIHHESVQVLVCVAGRGWYQEEGKAAVEMTPGKVIAIPAEVKHWHGAARDSWFQHLAYTTRVGANAGNEWLEPVTDAVYNQLP